MSHHKYLISLLFFCLLFSCERNKQEPLGRTSMRYYFIDSYIHPTSVELSEGLEIYFKSDNTIDMKSAPKLYKELASNHKETGKFGFYYWHPPFRKVPYGISKIQVFGTNYKGRKVDISDKTEVLYKRYKDFILSNYKTPYQNEKRLISSLNKDDLNWLTNPLTIIRPEGYDKFRVDIILDTGEVLNSN